MKYLSIIGLVLLFAVPGSANLLAAVRKVGPQQKYRTIQTAINSCMAGDTVVVSGGHYREGPLVIGVPVTLIGEQYPVLDGEHKYGILAVKADDVTIRGFKLVHSGVSSLIDIAGIKVYGCKRVRILDNKLEGTFFGIYLEKSFDCLIENNQVHAVGETDQQSGNGIHLWKCDRMRICGNEITGHRDGIYFEFVTRSVIWRNTASNNLRYGLHFMFSNNDIYLYNKFKNNNAGVSVMFSHHVKMVNNNFEDNWGDGCYGLFLKEITDSQIYGNGILRNTTGISMEGGSRILIQGNTFQQNGWALRVDASCMSDTISRNNFQGNSFDISTSGTTNLNCYDYNYWDKYEGYDLNRDRIGDIAYHPVSIFSMVVAQNPTAMILFRSVMATLFDKIEKIIPGITPENLVDNFPSMKSVKL